MDILRTLADPLIGDYAHSVVAVGNFDGVHLGHQALLNRCYAQAVRRACPALILTFEPHPREILSRPPFPAGEPAENFRLTNFAQKCGILAELKFDAVVALEFDLSLAAWSPTQFCQKVFAEGLEPELVVVGSDFCFGAKRAGTPEFLQAMGTKFGFDVEVVSKLNDGDEPISSTQIRTLIAAGQVAAVRQKLGRAWAMQGVVTRGDQRGRTLGFPTANLAPVGIMRPKFGVYAVRVKLPGALPGTLPGIRRRWDGVANFGIRPTVDGSAPRLEVHLFDFAGDLYDQTIEVALIDFIRPEQKFNSLPELVEQINIDVATAQNILKDDDGV
ncbi:MAG: bifunctional riboflavin kinase/FAD synthetase [Candidatus Symbiobacter sp.]|nr:bifunctional riboflavin kinase/FAD synthetase [Candidatus Symbiobacter sp.]